VKRRAVRCVHQQGRTATPQGAEHSPKNDKDPRRERCTTPGTTAGTTTTAPATTATTTPGTTGTEPQPPDPSHDGHLRSPGPHPPSGRGFGASTPSSRRGAETGTKRRPVLVVTRSEAIEVLTWIIVAPLTRTVRAIPTEVALGPDHGLAADCAASFDLQPIHRRALIARIGRLAPGEQRHLCRALVAVVHGEGVRIHPFANGSGRTARLLAAHLRFAPACRRSSPSGQDRTTSPTRERRQHRWVAHRTSSATTARRPRCSITCGT
jgi:mRNA interferase MazF